MRTETALKHFSQAKSNLRDLFSRARHFHFTHDQILAERKEIYNRLNKCPRWVTARLSGYFDAQIERLYEESLEYCSIQADGKVYSHYCRSHRYYGHHNISPRECCENATASGYYWVDTDKPFFITPTEKKENNPNV